MEKEVAVYLHKPKDELSDEDIENGVSELKEFAGRSGYNVVAIKVRAKVLDGKPVSEFIGNTY